MREKKTTFIAMTCKNVRYFVTCSSLVMELHGNSSRLRWGVGLGFLLEIKQGELGMLGMMSDRTSLPLVMSLPGNWRYSKQYKRQ